MSPASLRPLRGLFRSLGLTAVLAALLASATFWLGARLETESDWVQHTLTVENQISQVLVLVQRLETSQRGYLLTGRHIYLNPYADAQAALPAALDGLERLIADNPEQLETVAQLKQAVNDKASELSVTIEKHNAGLVGDALAIVNSDRGLQLMDRIRELLSVMRGVEDQLLTDRESRFKMAGALLQVGAAITLALICAVGLLAGYFTRRSFTELTSARDQLAITNRQLTDQMQQREQTEAQLRQMQKMKAIGDLTGGIAHDFNNMLGVIIGSLDLVRRRLKAGDFAVERFIEAANEATQRAASLTHRLLAFARQQPLTPQAIDANKMIVQMSDLLRSTLGEHISIETVTAAGLWLTSADLHQLENVVLNVAINARDAMPEGGGLTIETGNTYLDEVYCKQHSDVEPGQFVMIAVTDTGVGMAPDVVARAFDPFFTTKPPGAGTGLGLSQVYGFIKQSRGHIKIYSELGAGTTVKMYLPRLIGKAQEASTKPAAPLQRGGCDDVVLLVEDDQMMRRLAHDALRELGYTVAEAENAADALAILDERPDVKLLFTDVVMPHVNGRKLAEEALRRRSDLKVLFTTGYTRNAVVHGGVLDQGVQLLSKPFTLDQLAEKLRAVLDG